MLEPCYIDVRGLSLLTLGALFTSCYQGHDDGFGQFASRLRGADRTKLVRKVSAAALQSSYQYLQDHLRDTRAEASQRLPLRISAWRIAEF